MKSPCISFLLSHWLLAGLYFIAMSHAAMAQTLEIENPIRFLALGDSYTIGQSVPVNQRWPAQLKDSLATRGFVTEELRYIATTGWRTDNLINAISNQSLETQQYNLVTLLIGVNNQYQNRPFSQYENEFPALLDSAIRYAGVPEHVFVVSIPDYAFTPFGQNSNPNQISTELDQYNAYNLEVTDSFGVMYFDITPISRQGITHPEYVASDGLHPSGIQYTEWVKLMLETIDAQITGNSFDVLHELPVVVFPNPTSGEVQIQFAESYVADYCLLEVYSFAGSKVLVKNLYAFQSTLDFSDLANGIYVLKFISGNRQSIRKLVIHR